MPARRKNKRFSTPQRYDFILNKYRVRDYLTEEWYYVEKCPPHFVGYKYMFGNKCFRTLIELNHFVATEELWKQNMKIF